ncbi:hypothetical protein EC973_005789 [Apophysomyces ossiformis]|uniref:Methyltransferase domain-containing protein n=1 Tax=Apophysomyces ossiformis TaxID=679940 RepID=A0A8H7BK38_9FUNG|nr:hypothetical protein EC973_005789 [Apophysomyces ossiformis]
MLNYKSINFRWEGGRRLADNQDVAYILPSDQSEVDRLQLNHQMWKLYKSPIHEKLVKGIRVLDIGCGPGWWTLNRYTAVSQIQLIFFKDMAKAYPNSEFVGIDMADIFVTKNVPPNVSFRVMNAGTGLDFPDESFDFVFQRFLVMGFSVEQYLQSVKEMKRILKSGGSIEILELVNVYDNAGPALCQISSWINDAMQARGLDSFIADKISGYLQDAGYCNITDFNYNIPIGPWGGDVGRMFLAIQRMALAAVKVMVTELVHVTEEEYLNTMAKALNETNSYHPFTRFRLIHGVKLN